MEKLKLILILLAIGITTASRISAIEIKPGGLLFAHYQFTSSQHLQDGTDAKNINAFEISRIYLNATATYSEKINAFLQLEANLISHEFGKNSASPNQVFLKNAELRFNFHKAANLLAGLVSVPWRGYEEKIWNLRFVAKVLDDMEGIGQATDRGIRLQGKVQFLNYDAMISNGEGTGARNTSGNETATNGDGRFKDFQIRLAFSPLEKMGEWFAGLKANLLLYKGAVNDTKLRDRYFAGLSYESKFVNAMATYYNADNSAKTAPFRGEGFSIYSIVNPKAKWWLFARFDSYDPDLHTGGDKRNRYLYGAGVQVVKGIRIALDHQYLQQERRSATRQDESIFFLHSEAQF